MRSSFRVLRPRSTSKAMKRASSRRRTRRRNWCRSTPRPPPARTCSTLAPRRAARLAIWQRCRAACWPWTGTRARRSRSPRRRGGSGCRMSRRGQPTSRCRCRASSRTASIWCCSMRPARAWERCAAIRKRNCGARRPKWMSWRNSNRGCSLPCSATSSAAACSSMPSAPSRRRSATSKSIDS